MSGVETTVKVILTDHSTLYGWTATFYGYDGAEDAGGHDGPNAVGTGPTEIAAVRDLLTVAEDYIMRGALNAWDEYRRKREGDDRLNIKAAGERLRRLTSAMELFRILHDPQIAISPTPPEGAHE